MNLRTLCKNKTIIVCKNSAQFDLLTKALKNIGFTEFTDFAPYDEESEKGHWPSWATNPIDKGFVTLNPSTKTYTFEIAIFAGSSGYENVEFEKIEDFQWGEEKTV